MRIAMALVMGMTSLDLIGCGSFQNIPQTTANPQGVLSSFKAAVQRKDFNREWDLLSPGFKKRISERAGRNVDVGDYIFMRQKLRQDGQVRTMESLIGVVSIGSPRMQGQNQARVNVSAPGQSADIGMVRLTRWVLRVAGEDQPYTGILGDSAIRAEQRADGSVVVSQDGLEPLEFSRNEVLGYTKESRWYIDDLGALEQQFVQ